MIERHFAIYFIGGPLDLTKRAGFGRPEPTIRHLKPGRVSPKLDDGRPPLMEFSTHEYRVTQIGNDLYVAIYDSTI